MDKLIDFCEKIDSLTPQKAESFAKYLLNDNEKLETFVNLFLNENKTLSDHAFLFGLNYAVENLRIPFILYLNVPEFCDVTQARFERFSQEEEAFLKVILEQMLEKFLDFSYPESDLEGIEENIETLMLFYMNIFETDLMNFYQKRKAKHDQRPVQNIFEKLFNSAKTKIRKVNSEIELDPSPAQINALISIVENIELIAGQTQSEKGILLELIEEKDNLLMALKSFKEAAEEAEEVKIEEEKGEEVKGDGLESEKVVPVETKKKNKKNKKEEVPKLVYVEGDLELRTFFVFRSHSVIPENLEIEFKNYFLPWSEEMQERLEKLFCAFLNTHGGRVYLGVRDKDSCVFGLDLTTKDFDLLRLSVGEIMKRIEPKPESNEYEVHFIPVKNAEGEYMPGRYVPKIIVKRGRRNDLYFTSHGVTFERGFGAISQLKISDFKKAILKRGSISEKESEQENAIYNKKFDDPKPEIGIPKFMKVETKSKLQGLKALKVMKDKSNSLSKSKEGCVTEHKSIPIPIPPVNPPDLANFKVIFIGTPNLEQKLFETKFFPDFFKCLKEAPFSVNIQTIILVADHKQIYVQTSNNFANGLHDVIKIIANNKFKSNNPIVNWAFMDRYNKILVSKKYLEIQIN